MIDLKGEKVILKNGQEATIEDQDERNITIMLQGIHKKYSYYLAFSKATLTAANPDVQAEIIRTLEDYRPVPVPAPPINLPLKYPDTMFPADYHVEFLRRNPILTYEDVERQFKIKIRGFGRGINVTDSSIVLISNMVQNNQMFVYHDHWEENGDFIFSGEGLNGDQKMTKGNFAIANASYEKKKIYLLIKFSSKEYYFQGEMICLSYSKEDDRDSNGNLRKEYKFRLRKDKQST